jgi:hypothetical protein
MGRNDYGPTLSAASAFAVRANGALSMIQSGGMSYTDATLQQLNEAATYRIYGRTLQFPKDIPGAGSASASRHTPIWPCYCVQDSPDSPCECAKGMRWWLMDSAIVAHGSSGKKDSHGNELEFFDVSVESKIMVESIRPITAATLKKIERGDTSQSTILQTIMAARSVGGGGGGAGGGAGGANPAFWVDLALALLAAVIVEGAKEVGVFDPIPWPPKPPEH